MNPETVITALRHCSVRASSCRECPAYNQDSGCLDRLHAQAATLLDTLTAQLAAAEAERDIITKRMIQLEQDLGAALADLKKARQ